MIPMPMNSSLSQINNEDYHDFSTKPVDDIGFELLVPPITFFKITMQPVVYASVNPREDRVEILSTTCILRGSQFIEQVNLNDRFDFCVNTTLTWEDSLSQIYSSEGSNIRDGDNNDSPNCSITVETQIGVDVDVPMPFNSIPKIISQKTGNVAVGITLKLIQGTFANNLAKDYAKWATDLEYRNYRASLSEKEVLPIMDELVVIPEVQCTKETTTEFPELSRRTRRARLRHFLLSKITRRNKQMSSQEN